jgi:hypothetical protein
VLAARGELAIVDWDDNVVVRARLDRAPTRNEAGVSNATS